MVVKEVKKKITKKDLQLNERRQNRWHGQQFILYKTHAINQKETEIEENLEKIWTFM